MGTFQHSKLDRLPKVLNQGNLITNVTLLTYEPEIIKLVKLWVIVVAVPRWQSRIGAILQMPLNAAGKRSNVGNSTHFAFGSKREKNFLPSCLIH